MFNSGSLYSTNLYLAYLLENGALYHIANGAAILEYLASLYFMPTSKSYRYVSQIGENKFEDAANILHFCRDSDGTGWSSIAFCRHDPSVHQLFPYRCISKAWFSSTCYRWDIWVRSLFILSFVFSCNYFVGGFAIPHMPVSIIGHLAPSWCFKIHWLSCYLPYCCGDSSITAPEVSILVNSQIANH